MGDTVWHRNRGDGDHRQQKGGWGTEQAVEPAVYGCSVWDGSGPVFPGI